MSKTFGSKGYSSSDFEADLFGGSSDSGWQAKKSKGSKSYQACYNTHPTLKLGGGTLYGGSCITPIITDADVYIGLDYGMRVQPYAPWESDRVVQQILYEITDMAAPKDSKSFAKLVDFVCNQLQQGKHVHAGCIGGHGRTGTLFAALFKVINGDADATTTVRKMYCKRAVESEAQINFLHKHFGITKVSGTKSSMGSGFQSYGSSMKGITDHWPKSGASEIKKPSTTFANAKKVWNAVNSPHKFVGILV